MRTAVDSPGAGGSEDEMDYARWTSGNRDLKWRTNNQHIETYVAVWRNKR
ncbi:MAG: hypothetical protein ABSE90_08475 [Verrucomicrobiota bacterium]